MSTVMRQRIEKGIADVIITLCLAKGYMIGINNGEDKKISL